MSRRLPAAPFALALAACAVGPAYTPPEPALPPAFAAAQAAALAADEAQLAAWWTTFDDATLTRLVARALADGHDVRLAAARVAAARAAAGVADAGGRPAVDAGAGVARQRLSENALFAPPVVETRTVHQIGFDSSWELDLFGRVRHARDAAAAELAAAVAVGHDARVRLAAEVARTYVELRAVAARCDAARRALALHDEAVALWRARAAGGVASGRDVDAATAAQAGAAAVLPDLELARAVAGHRLALLLALPPTALADELAAPTPTPRGPRAIAVGLPRDLLRRRPDVRAAERELAAHAARVGVATADLYPRLSLDGSFALQSTSAGNLFDAGSRTFAFGPGLQLPLFRGGALRAQLAAATAAAEAAAIRHERTVLAACAEVADGLAALQRHDERRDRLDAALAAERRRTAQLRALQTQGVADRAEVLAAELAVAHGEQALAAVDGDAATARIALFKALGGGWPQADVGADATPTAADDDQRRVRSAAPHSL